MKKLSLSVISALLLLTGCSGGGEDTANNTSIPPQNPTPVTPVTPETPNNNNINNNISSSSGLIPSTNPQDRLQQINQGRNDPFNSINPPPVITIKTDQFITESLTRNNAIIKKPPVTKEETSNLNRVTANHDVAMINGKTVNGNNQIGKNNSPREKNQASNQVTGEGNKLSPFQPPTSPQPEDARNITLSGILSLNGENVALIQTPWDNATRSVRIGDVISDNSSGISVRVKDINFGYSNTIALFDNNQIVLRNLNDNNAVIILEQFGQRVTRQIGDNIGDNNAQENLGKS
ncbi:hypothetical protein [Geminocystis sp. GBBB08]|uniref:hypothetical protein n=1 Tax=Geminocystis sp. GBBB08 TaxID=2604140 RepID=UPI0027E2280E|nr:hypothetical protein [Geminocystis sp. GBBB08]MBL1208390.1 hypothetical protein [Geminocystis sp. GBBB08]